jgi:O-antigen/teichoic acid export membrane protein
MSDSAVGLYNAAFPTALLILIPHQAFGTLALSSFSELGSKKEEGLSSAMKTITNWTFALVFPAFLIMALFSEQIIQILFGKEYLAAAPALTILAFGNLVNAAVGRVGSFMKSRGRTKILLYNSIVVLAVNIALNILLIPKLGITGAAIATASSTILGNLIVFLLVWRYEKIVSLDRNMVKTLFAGLVSLTVVYIIIDSIFQTTPLWALIPSGIMFYLIYFLLFFKIGGLKEYDKEILLTAGARIGMREETEKILKLLD